MGNLRKLMMREVREGEGEEEGEGPGGGGGSAEL